MRLDHLAQAVLFGSNLFVVVEHVCQIVFRIRQRGRQIQHHRVGALHIGGTAPPYHALLLMAGGNILANQRIAWFQPSRREVVDHRHCVKMPGENHAAFTSEIRGRNQRIAMPAHCQMLLFVQKHFDGIGQRAFVVAHGIGAHDLFHQPVQLLLPGGGSGKSNLKFVHTAHYPAPPEPTSPFDNAF